MVLHADVLRSKLAFGPKSGTQISKEIGLSQPTVTRALAGMGGEVIKFGQKKSSKYLLRDQSRGFSDIPVYCVDLKGLVKEMGVLSPVRSEGYLFTKVDGGQKYFDGLPWWLFDMRPQGYMGRAFASKHGLELGLPDSVNQWSDSNSLHALLHFGVDVVGNLLLGDKVRNQFIEMKEPQSIEAHKKAETYSEFAIQAANGQSAGSSAGGEQPKFTAFVQTDAGHGHAIVKFSEKTESPVSQRWRDLLLAEHLALTTLACSGVPAAKSNIVEGNGQRFLELQRFDRKGMYGRCPLVSLTALDAEFVGAAPQIWPVIVKSLVKQGVVSQKALELTEILWAFGQLIGNTDMHNGNLSFMSEENCPLELSPVYDMVPMTFAPTSGGGLRDSINPISLNGNISHAVWIKAEVLARAYLLSIKQTNFSSDFQVCINALENHVERTAARIRKLH